MDRQGAVEIEGGELGRCGRRRTLPAVIINPHLRPTVHKIILSMAARASATLDRGAAVVVEWPFGNSRFLNLPAQIMHSAEPGWRAMVSMRTRPMSEMG
jgi:hypothetical protein